QVHLEEAADLSVVGGEGVDERGAIDRVDDARVAARLAGLVALQLADEVPDRVQVGGPLGLRPGLLVAVLAEVAHAEPVQLAHEPRGVELGDDDRGELVHPASRRPGGVRDAGLDRREPLGEPLAVIRGHLRKSGTSRSPSSSSKAGSLGAAGSCGSSSQTRSASSVATLTTVEEAEPNAAWPSPSAC